MDIEYKYFSYSGKGKYEKGKVYAERGSTFFSWTIPEDIDLTLLLSEGQLFEFSTKYRIKEIGSWAGNRIEYAIPLVIFERIK